MSDRLTKQQLKEDPLMKTTGDAVDFLREHGRLLAGLAVGIVVLVSTVLIVRSSSDRAEETAAGLLAEARADLGRGVFEPAAARLQEILRDMGGTKSGKQALLVYSDARYAQGRYQEAEQSYRAAVDSFADDPILGVVARRGLAATLENLARPAEAATVYKLLADTAPNDDIRTELRMDLARNYAKAGQVDLAEAIYKSISTDVNHPNTADHARQRLAEMKVQPPG